MKARIQGVAAQIKKFEIFWRISWSSNLMIY